MENIKKNFNKNDLKYKLKAFTNKPWKKALLVVSSLILLNTIIFIATGKNLIERSIKALLYQAGIYTEEVRLVDINSPGWYTYEAGSWHINKSAEWIGENKAQITIDLSTRIKTNDKDKDVILVLDISGSMYGEKIDKVKNDAIELTEYILSSPKNKISLITFDTTSEILSDFTTDKEYLINTLENLETRGTTNYNAALKNVSTILSSYNFSTDRDAVVLFLTDGYPNEDTPNQISEYKYLKEQYPYLLIEGIQYEMGESIIKEIIEISDKQFMANIANLNNVLFEASLLPDTYESFEITDYI
ncbi:MAG: VWA domain-containing protein, partial [Bacilli bacterium]|nr:VWA domain-containing protein [Bacilli bacterium]